jgi:hypothetical protein
MEQAQRLLTVSFQDLPGSRWHIRQPTSGARALAGIGFGAKLPR